MSDEKFNWPAKIFCLRLVSWPRSSLNYSLRSLPVSYIAIFWVTTLDPQTMKSEVRACERLSAYFRKFCLEETGHDLLCIRDLTVVVLDLSSPAIYRVSV
jgi:hypothetical protein